LEIDVGEIELRHDDDDDDDDDDDEDDDDDDDDKLMLNLSVVCPLATTWSPPGHTVASFQFSLPSSFPSPSHGRSDRSATRWIPLDNNNNNATTQSSSFRLSPSTGNLTDFGDGLITKMSSSYTRATTDNDRGGAQMLLDFLPLPPPLDRLASRLIGTSNFSHEYDWKRAGIAASDPELEEVSEGQETTTGGNGMTTVQCKGSIGGGHFSFVKRYTARVGGDVVFEGSFAAGEPVRSRVRTLPRIGVRFEVDGTLCNVTYVGRGPHENYPDRMSSADFGVYETTVGDMHTDYVVPSENGCRCECREVEFADGKGRGVRIKAVKGGPRFNFTASHYSVGELENATHTNELEPRENGRDKIYVNIDTETAGVGGDCSWLPCIYEQFRVDPKKEHKIALLLQHF